jgi:hypothetical protein
MEYDFDALTDYNDFVNQVSRTLEVVGNGGASNQVNTMLNAAINEAHQVNLSGLGDVVRGSVSYHGIFDTTDAYSIIVITNESVV